MIKNSIKQERSLKDQVAIVTGGTVGIGRAACLALAKEGVKIVIVGRNQTRLGEIIAELSHQTKSKDYLGLALDVRRDSDTEEMAKRTLERFGCIDILITAAGILRAKGGNLRTLNQMKLDEWNEVIDTNLKGVFLSNRAVLPAMIRQRSGNIINISSTSGRKGLAFDSAYCASKFGVIGLSESLSEEMRQYGIRVQTILPGAIETGMWNQNGPLPRPEDILSTERVADLIIYLLALPEDMILSTPIIEPLKRRHRARYPGRDVRGNV